MVEAIEAMGGTVLTSHPRYDLIRARVPLSQLETLASKSTLTGQDEHIIPGQEGSGSEGSAMLEVIHDPAPGAHVGIAVGAADVKRSGDNDIFGPEDLVRVEHFGSDGPRRVFFDADGNPLTPNDLSSTGGVLRHKPDVIAADQVITTTSFQGLNVVQALKHLQVNAIYFQRAAGEHVRITKIIALRRGPTTRQRSGVDIQRRASGPEPFKFKIDPMQVQRQANE